ncbi:SIP domain-containing protein [Catenuloplanes japonicus]|uniref:SIP domain-containing protein n=1 Tax=Catenuloplanes japonicus TaxID=33876 RepID=UPI00068FA739|nr:SIP domain-containing protein [Catenuloplanes japonicus]
MTTSPHVWRARAYQTGSTGRFETALEALMQAGAHLHTGGRFADLGCGTGELAAAMAARGFEVTASDAGPHLVDAARERCAGLPVTAEVRDAHDLRLPARAFEVVHSSWMLHRLADARPAIRAMARATAPGGLLVLQYSCGQPRADGFALGDVIAAVTARPAWRDRLADVPMTLYQHPLDETVALLAAEGLQTLLTDDAVRVPGGEDPDSLRPALREAVRAERLGDDADTFLDECLTALHGAGAPGPHHVRIIARRPLPHERGAARPGPVRAFPLSVGLLEVVTAAPVTPLMRRITFRTIGADPLPLTEPAETITLLWPADGAGDVVLPETGRWRFPPGTPRQHSANITVRAYDAPLLTADFYLHAGDGHAARWAAGAQPGDRVGFGGSRVHWVRDPAADWTLLLGDETALPSIAAIIETLPPGHRVITVAEAGGDAERSYLSTATQWVARGGLPARIEALDLPPGRGQIFGGAESHDIRRIRTHLLTARGLSRDQVSLQGYWARPRGQEQR